MCSYFQNVRRVTDNRSLINDLSRRFARFQSDNSVTQASDSDFIRKMRVNFDRVDFTGNHYNNAVISRSTQFKIPMEPDGDKLRLWLRFDSPATIAKDSSGFQNQAEERGAPVYVSASEVGFGQAIKFDGVRDYIGVIDNDLIKINNIPYNPRFSVFDKASFDNFQYDSNSGATEGKQFSISVWISSASLELGGVGLNVIKVIASKTDDSGNGWIIGIKPDGSINFTVKDFNYISSSQSIPGAAATLDTWYHVVCVYDFVDQVPRVFVNGVGSTALDVPLPLNNPLFTTELRVGANDNPGKGGNFHGSIDEFRLYRGIALTQSQVTNLYTNLFSISNIAPGQVAVIGFNWYFSRAPSFTKTSFTSVSYTSIDLITQVPYLYDDFINLNLPSGYGIFFDGDISVDGKWIANSVGGGTIGVDPTDHAFFIAPGVSDSAFDSHVGIAGPFPVVTYQNVSTSIDVMTSEQSRVGSAPKDYEMGQVWWSYSDESHYYYFVFKTTGWEFGKYDGDLPDKIPLVQGTIPYALFGEFNTFTITQNFSNTKIKVDGILLTSFDDTTQSEILATGGEIRLAAVDCFAKFDNVYIKPLPNT